MLFMQRYDGGEVHRRGDIFHKPFSRVRKGEEFSQSYGEENEYLTVPVGMRSVDSSVKTNLTSELLSRKL